MKFSRNLRLAALVSATCGLSTAAATAQTFDAQIASIEVTQALPESVLNVPLTAGRSTYVRVESVLTNPPSSTVDLDGIMRVYVNGLEVPESPIYSRNGPYPAKNSPNLNVRNGTLNFIYLPPASNNVVFEVELNPAGPNFVPESNTNNNTMSTAALNFTDRAIADFAYLPIDYRPGGGGGPNLPDPNLIDPGIGDNFIQGIFPGKDIYYRRTDQPSLLWTSSLNFSGSGLLSSMQNFWLTMSPRPDFLYAWVPGALPNYNGQAFLNSAVSMGNSEQIRHQRTYAHEVGHNTGLSHTNWTIQARGVDQEHHLNITEGLPFIKTSSLRNIMDAGLLTQDAWVRDTHWEHFANHPKFQSPSPAAPVSNDPVLSVAGLYDVASRTFTLESTMLADPVEATPSVNPSTADFEVTVYRGSDLAQRLFAVSPTVTDSCAQAHLDESTVEGSTDSLAGIPTLNFNALLTQGAEPFDRLVIRPMGRVEAEPIVLDRSANAPEVSFVTPLSDVLQSPQFTLEWAADDLDGDDLQFYVRYSRDGQSFTPLHLGALTETSLEVDLTELPTLINGVSFFEIQATDGLNFTVLQSDQLVGSAGVLGLLVNPPFVHISTPDSGKDYERGATVILHTGGWDIEDRQLEGSELVWTSSLDGPIGTGRLTSIATLSVGVHTITVTGTDSDGLMSSDTTTITINDRGLPGEGGIVNYCTPGTSASGCVATLSSAGTPSATAASGFTVTASDVEGVKDGLFFFGTSGRQANPWGSGTSFQCVVPPTIRTGVLTGTGTLGACDGSANRDMNATWNAIPAKNPGSGAVVQLQFWYRDPQNTSNQTTSLTDALEFTVDP